MREGTIIIRWGTTAASSRRVPVRPARALPCGAKPTDGLKRMSGRIPPQARGTQSIIM